MALRANRSAFGGSMLPSAAWVNCNQVTLNPPEVDLVFLGFVYHCPPGKAVGPGGLSAEGRLYVRYCVAYIPCEARYVRVCTSITRCLRRRQGNASKLSRYFFVQWAFGPQRSRRDRRSLRDQSFGLRPKDVVLRTVGVHPPTGGCTPTLHAHPPDGGWACSVCTCARVHA